MQLCVSAADACQTSACKRVDLSVCPALLGGDRPLRRPRILPPRDRRQILLDHWLLVEMRGRDPALTGQKLLVVACGLRARLGALLSGALVEAEKRKGAGGGSSGGVGYGAGAHDRHRDPSAQDGARTRQAEEEEGEALLLQDLPPLLLMARRAWLEEGQLGGGTELDRRRGMGGGSDRRRDRDHAEGVDWAKEAEDLSVDLAEFMLQSIG